MCTLAGFTDISPEELRFEYQKLQTSNDLQTYLNSIQQLVSQWKDRVNELKSRNTSTKIVLFSNTKDGVNHSAPAFGFGSRQTTFGSQGFPMNKSSSDNVQNFSFKTSPISSGSPSVFGNTPAFGAVSSASSVITTSAPAFGFGKPGMTSTISFSFKNPAISSSGPPGFSGFPASTVTGPAGAPAFGSSSSMTGFGSSASQSHIVSSKSSSDASGNSSRLSSFPVSNGSTSRGDLLFTPKDQLTTEELEQFQCKKFTPGKIPIKPPPVELLDI
ncbi:nucleoporin NUP42 isoform X2 [Erinaceus europaeus]|uniref:Nucleoporin NUP42 isoform X2 n=1 Tax=Erinaceus europaeus TaxID=9365 RepID=A0ABM3XTC9_ERIEU|nr:nucleoporin NUP42 isoform X2 [Erinaceus europaeus]